MGSTQSTACKSSTLPNIKDAEQFQTRLRQLLRTYCLSRREQDWLQAIFESFGTLSEKTEYWTESDLVDFIKITLPEKLHPDLKTAGPLLYRCLLHLGAFPWHNTQITSQQLSLDNLSTAMILLLRRHEIHLSSQLVPGDADNEEQESMNKDTWFYGLIFQCMSLPSDVPRKSIQRDDADDMHLIQAHALVSAHNTQRMSNPKVMKRGPPIISVSEMPSSSSKDFSGMIPAGQFRALVKLLLTSELYLYGHKLDHVFSETDELDSATDGILSNLSEPDSGDITWDDFQATLSTSAPNIFSSFGRLFATFLVDHNLNHDLLRTKRNDEVVPLIQKTFLSTFKPQPVPTGSIFNIHILSQLATLLPSQLPLQSASLVYSALQKELDLGIVGKILHSSDRPLLLLLRGTILKQGQASDTKEECILGAFLPQDRISFASIFQLRPTQKVSSVSNYSLQSQVNPLRLELSINLWLELDSRSNIARLQLLGDGRANVAASPEVKISNLDVVGFDADRTKFDYPLDLTFYISESPNLTE